MAEYRPVPDDRVADFRAMVRDAFQPAAGPHEPDPDERLPPPATMGERRALFEGDELLSVCRHLWLALSVRGERLDAAGLASVVTPPEHRRRGLVRELAAASLSEYRDRGCPLSVLWPFDHRFYRRLGWGLAGRFATYEVPPDALAFAGSGDRSDAANDAETGTGNEGRIEAGDGSGTGERFRRLSADDWEAVAPVIRVHNEPYSLAMDRTEEWWRNLVFAGVRSDPYVYAWERDGGVRGYLACSVEDSDDESRLQVRDLAYADHGALVALLRLCYYHDSQVDAVEIYGPTDLGLLDLVPDPREVECTVNAGPMVRLVDVGALASLAVPGDDRRVVLSVSDQLAEWNDGTVAVESAGGEVSVEPAAGDPDVETDVATLSQVAVGYRPAADAAAAGDLTVHDDGAVDALGALFPPEHMYLREFF